ncbi:MAG TPA: DUF362 domain-containing protein, partial [Prolixibacteraceae bacterium]|nr:DUF362 domain-containing protein [Prolixibacteraceae bacterium]
MKTFKILAAIFFLCFCLPAFAQNEALKVKPSTQPLHWSSRPQSKAQDCVPACFAEAQYLINFANLKAHTGGGVTLCAKNHFGSLIRWPVQQ